LDSCNNAVSGAIVAPPDGADAAFDAAILDGFELAIICALPYATLDSGVFQDACVFDWGGVSRDGLYVELWAESIDLDGGVFALGDRRGLVIVVGWFGTI
jgi:hypothetical protein